MKEIKKSFYDWCVENDEQQYLDLWDYELNNKKPNEVTYGDSRNRYYFKCPRMIHESESNVICDLTTYNTKLGCRKCNSFGQHLVDTHGEDAIEQYWSHRNMSLPFKLGKSSHNSIYINCQNDKTHGEYKTKCSDFGSGKRCPICSNHKVVKGINDVATTHPDIVKYFVNIEDAYKYSYGSGKKVLTECPDCHHKRKITIAHMASRRYTCTQCSDGISYPEKFLISVLSQLKLDFEHDRPFEWSNNKRYDFYIPSLNYIIETHGLGHYTDCFLGFDDKATLEKEQENDAYKEKLAKDIIKCKYISLNCSESNVDFIKKSILESDMQNDFDLSNIDWDVCDGFAQKSTVITACDLWNKGLPIMLIKKEIKVSGGTTKKYLVSGKKLGICDYTEKEAHRRGHENKLLTTKKVKYIEKNIIYDSMTELADISKEKYGIELTIKGISKVCTGYRKSYKGQHFEYVTE